MIAKWSYAEYRRSRIRTVGGRIVQMVNILPPQPGQPGMSVVSKACCFCTKLQVFNHALPKGYEAAALGTIIQEKSDLILGRIA